MKIRSRFVSNSSSTSFIIEKSCFEEILKNIEPYNRDYFRNLAKEADPILDFLIEFLEAHLELLKKFHKRAENDGLDIWSLQSVMDQILSHFSALHIPFIEDMISNIDIDSIEIALKKMKAFREGKTFFKVWIDHGDLCSLLNEKATESPDRILAMEY